MSLKENVDYIKEEISTQESFMEKFFKLEKFYKKYKLLLIVSGLVLVVGTIGYYTSKYMQEENKIKANIAFNTLLKNPNDANAKKTLEETNSKLYAIIQNINNNDSSIELTFFKEINIYKNAISKNSIDGISSATQEQAFLLKDFALINKAILEAKKKDYLSAKETVQLISEKSEVAPLKIMLEHFLLTK